MPTRFNPSTPIDSKVKLSHGEVLKLSLTFLGGEELAVPHQAYLLVKQSDTGLETFFPLDTHASTAKAKLEVVRGIPDQLQEYCLMVVWTLTGLLNRPRKTYQLHSSPQTAHSNYPS